MFFEVIGLLVAVKRIDEKFTSQHETIKLSFDLERLKGLKLSTRQSLRAARLSWP
jgi:hypothetical protein